MFSIITHQGIQGNTFQKIDFSISLSVLIFTIISPSIVSIVMSSQIQISTSQASINNAAKFDTLLPIQPSYQSFYGQSYYPLQMAKQIMFIALLVIAPMVYWQLASCLTLSLIVIWWLDDAADHTASLGKYWNKNSTLLFRGCADCSVPSDDDNKIWKCWCQAGVFDWLGYN